jgi:Flp pilus assembly protein TadG
MRKRVFEVVEDCTGAAFLEFALVLPVLLLVVFGITQLGQIFYHYTLVTGAAAAGARQLSISAHDPNACTDTLNAMMNASGTLGGNTPVASGSCPTTIGGLAITLYVWNTTTSSFAQCTSNSSCYSDLQNAEGTSTPAPAKVTATFACSAEDLIPAPGFAVHLGVCPLTSTMQAPVQ